LTITSSRGHHSRVPATNALLRRLSRPHRVIVVFLRLLVMVTCVGLSGLAPAVEELIVRSIACQDGVGCSDCPLEKDGKECPPGCPNCHCSHAGLGLPQLGAILLSTVAPQFEAAAVPYEAAVPRAPPASDVYRPPRGVVTRS
jgi:hypothetical protein